jgi:hypothetical protein
MPKKIKKTFNFTTDEGARYSVDKVKPPARENAEGLCDDPSSKHPKIIIDPDLLPRREMAVTIEEFAHSFFWEKTEKKVRKFSAVLTKYLYSQGWRKVI